MKLKRNFNKKWLFFLALPVLYVFFNFDKVELESTSYKQVRYRFRKKPFYVKNILKYNDTWVSFFIKGDKVIELQELPLEDVNLSI